MHNVDIKDRQYFRNNSAGAGYERLFAEAAERLEGLGGVRVAVDFEAFAAAAAMLYTSAFLAERYSGVRAFLEAGQVGDPNLNQCPTTTLTHHNMPFSAEP